MRRSIVALLLLAAVASPATAQPAHERLLENHRWYLPVGEALATVVAVPGCSGVSLDGPRTDPGRPGQADDVLFRRHYPKMAERLRDAGFAVLLLDLLGAEGVINACRGEIPAGTVAGYISAAIELATSETRAGSSSLFVIGWSMGGGGLVRWLAEPRGPDAVRAAVAVYPNCGGRPPVRSRVPLLMLLGGADDIAEPEECEALVEGSPAASWITVRSYDGARHGFDIEDAPPVLDVGGGRTVGFQEHAAREAWEEVLRFLREKTEERPEE